MNWKERTGAAEVTFSDFLPEISLPKVLSKLGYHTVAKVSMPVLNKYTLISKHFDEYKLMSHHNDFATMVEEMEFPDDEPQYYFLNLGETHYPYMLSATTCRTSQACTGRSSRSARTLPAGPQKIDEAFNPEQLKMLHKQQIKCVEYIDGLIGKLIEKAPKDT